MSDFNDFTLPTNQDDLKAIAHALEDIVAQTRMIKDRQESINEIKKDLKDSYSMPTALINKLVKGFDDADYEKMTTSNSIFETVRETILGS